MAAAAYFSLSSLSPLLITAPPSSQRKNNQRGVASFGCTPRRSSGLVSGKLVLRHSKMDRMDVRVSAAGEGITPEGSGDSNGNNEVEKPNLSKISTILMNVKNELGDPHLASSIPIYQTATYKQKSVDTFGTKGTYGYTRFGNPTRDMLESILAKLDKAERALAYTSGMAALTAVTHLVKTGDEIVLGADIYGGSDLLLKQIAERTGVVVKRVDMSNLVKVKEEINSKTKLVWLESPTNPQIQISDIHEIAKITHDQGLKAVEAVKAEEGVDGTEGTKGTEGREGTLLLVDNSIMSPVLSRPLELGADIVMHSATKFIGGHSDVMAGVLAVKDEKLATKSKILQNAEGSGLAPFDCWICLRGIKTMALRVEKQQANAQLIAEFLYDCTKDTISPIKTVNYVGLPTHPGCDIHFKQADGAGSVLSFTTGSVDTSKRIVKNVQLFALTVSFGNVKSLISMPVNMSHASVSEEDLEAVGLKKDLIRISVGIEDAKELIDDLKQALNPPPPVTDSFPSGL